MIITCQRDMYPYQVLHSFLNLRLQLEVPTVISYSALIFMQCLLFTQPLPYPASQGYDVTEKDVVWSNIETVNYLGPVVLMLSDTCHCVFFKNIRYPVVFLRPCFTTNRPLRMAGDCGSRAGHQARSTMGSWQMELGPVVCMGHWM